MHQHPITSALVLLATLLTTLGCGEQESSTTAPHTTEYFEAETQKATQTIKDMLVLAKAGQWTTFLERYHGYYAKLKTPQEKKQFLDTFIQNWGKHLPHALDAALNVSPWIEKNRATFTFDNMPIFELHRTHDGKWMFQT